MSEFLAGFDVLAASAILGSLLLAALLIWFALDSHVIDEGVERRRREPGETAMDSAGAPAGAPHHPATAPRAAAAAPAGVDDPNGPRRAA